MSLFDAAVQCREGPIIGQ